MTDIGSEKWFLPMDVGAEKTEPGEGTNAFHPLRVQQRFIQCKSKLLFSVCASEFDLIFSFPGRPLGGAVSINKQATDSNKGQTVNVPIRGFVE